jgi:hypothetical protein
MAAKARNCAFKMAGEGNTIVNESILNASDCLDIINDDNVNVVINTCVRASTVIDVTSL